MLIATATSLVLGASFLPAAGAFAASAAPLTSAPLAAATREEADGRIASFYESRNYQPLWIKVGKGGRPHVGEDAQVLLRLLDTTSLDGLKSSRYKPDRLREAIAESDGGDPRKLAAVEVALTRAFVRLVGDMRKTSDVGMEFVGDGLKPPKLKDDAILRVAARRSFPRYLRSMAWMSPRYVAIRQMLASTLAPRADARTVDMLRLNLERARVLPSADVRHIVVDAASARLWYYENGREVGTMRIVVGAPETQTPMLAGYINWAIVNPYWNIPDYLTRDNVAKKVLAGRSLESMDMEVLSDWSSGAKAVDPASIDWQAVRDGKLDLRIREKPGPSNSMGKVKFLFPNDHGIYLHDTPNRDLLKLDDRHRSNGCIRLDDAATLGKWMMGKPIVTKGKAAETPEALPVPVPVYLTYLTVTPVKSGKVALLDDVYRRDKL